MIEVQDLTEEEAEILETAMLTPAWRVLFNVALKKGESLRRALESEENSRERDLFIKGQLWGLRGVVDLASNLEARKHQRQEPI